MDIFGNVNKANIFSRQNGHHRSNLGLRMAPMIDMIFLLLIFFLVAAKWRPKEDYLPLQLATAGFGVGAVGKPEPLLIQISQADAVCRVQIGSLYAVDIPAQNSEQGLATLIEKIRQCLLEQKRYAADPVEIICSPDVKWENLAKIYNVFVGMGLNDITFQMTEASTDESAR
jgi:biopolymer transport protein ExbD